MQGSGPKVEAGKNDLAEPKPKQRWAEQWGARESSPVMPRLTERLIAAEHRSGSKEDPRSRAAFRVCEKLRRPLCTFAGVAGFRSLLLRALALARADAPLLEGVQVTPGGTFKYSPEMEAQLDTPEAARAAAALADQLLGLLFTFIGEALTLRLVHDVWPNAVSKDTTPEGD